jgi:hypothetical protein
MSGVHTGKFVAYYRVSPQRQGRSGLGLEDSKLRYATSLMAALGRRADGNRQWQAQ